MKAQTRELTALLEEAVDGGFVVKCLELPVVTEGETRAEAIATRRSEPFSGLG